MEWQHPEALYLILPLAVAWFGISLYSRQQRQKARAAFADRPMWPRIFPADSNIRFFTKLVLRELALITGLISLAGPRFGMHYEQVVPKGSDLYVLIDVSRSMLADDVPPSRLERAKADVSSLLNRLTGERVGLIAFAGQAVVKCPLTIDYDSFRRALEELDPDSAPRGGTAIGDAIRKALEVFQNQTERDQAILLMTDGDDQQSYPLEAASVAAERHVTIFAIGLGDAEQGARVPQKGDAKSFMEYKGEQVWSKLDGSLLQQIALKTQGVYVPAGTRSYDLGQLYTEHLQGRAGKEEASQQRIRRSERFQIFLSTALFALLLDLLILPYRARSVAENGTVPPGPTADNHVRRQRANASQLVTSILIVAGVFGRATFAAEPATAVREGLRLYAQEKYGEARDKFASAEEQLETEKSTASAVAAFDQACADQKQGKFDAAREAYLRAGLSRDLKIATAAHFNLGNLAAEQARTLCGERPEEVAPDQRQPILDQLSQAVASYRHCLELQPSHAAARRNLEMIRQWIKYYTDRWRERDLQKRRNESSLMQFLEFLIQTQTALRTAVDDLPAKVDSNTIAEIKRAQEELREEIPTLREKIAEELRPPQDPNAAGSKPTPPELEEAIALLREWADAASKQMTSAARQLDARQLSAASADQQRAIEELERIWDAIVPFQPLLQRLVIDQSAITESLKPQEVSDSKDQGEPQANNPADETVSDPREPATSSQLEFASETLKQLRPLQEKTLKRTRQLAPKAQKELEHLESQPNAGDTETPAHGSAPAVDPEQAKAGYQKAIELAPQAVEEMEAALQSIDRTDSTQAHQHAAAAHRLLKEIAEAQPKPPQNPEQQNQDQQDDSQKQNQQQQPSPDQQRKNQNQDQAAKDQPQDKSQQKSDDTQRRQAESDAAQGSQDRLEKALRMVRERQQQKRERDRKLKGLSSDRARVDKDW